MDFAVPDFILDPLHEQLEHPIIGYTKKPDSLTLALQNWLMHHYGWQVPEEWIVWLPGVVPGLNMAVNTLAARSFWCPPHLLPFLRSAGKFRAQANCCAVDFGQRPMVDGLCRHERCA